VAEVDFVARAPAGQEVEELTQKQIVKCLRNKIPADQFADMLNIPSSQTKNGEKGGRRDEDRGDRHRRDDDRGRPKEPMRAKAVEERPVKRFSPEQLRLKTALEELSNTSKARLINESGAVVKEMHVSLLAESLKEGTEGVTAIVLDGIITQRILDLAVEKNISSVVGVKLGNVAKLPSNVDVLTKEDLT